MQKYWERVSYAVILNAIFFLFVVVLLLLGKAMLVFFELYMGTEEIS